MRVAVIDLRDAYATLSNTPTLSTEQLDECRNNIERAHDTIAVVRARRAAESPNGSAA